MTRDERLMYNRAINVIDYKILGRPTIQTVPTIEQMEVLPFAVEAMERQMREIGKPLHRHIAVLQYHISHPSAILFKDIYTTNALTQGILAMKWLIGRDDDERMGGVYE